MNGFYKFLAFRSWSLRLKMTAAALLVLLAGIWGIVLYALSSMQDSIQQQQMDRALAQVRHHADDLDEKLADYLIRLEATTALIDKVRLDDPAYLAGLLAARYDYQPQLAPIGLNIMDRTGRSVADYPAIPGRHGTQFGEREYFRQVMATAKPFIDEPVLGWISNRPILALSVPIIGKVGETWGVLSGVIDLSRPNLLGLPFGGKQMDGTERYVVSLDTEVFVANSQGLEKMSPLPPPGKSAFADRLRGGFTGVTVSSGSGEVEKVYAAARMRAKNWAVVEAIPTADLFKPVSELRLTVLGGATLTTLVAMLLMFWLARRTMAPLEEAARQLDAMSSGKQPLGLIAPTGDPEVRSLVASFNRLTARIEKDRLRSETILRTASDGIHILDGNGLLVEANDAFLEMLGYDRGAIGRLHGDAWDAQDSWEVIKARHDGLIFSEGKKVFETRHKRRDGQIIDVEINARGFEVDGQPYLIAASRDITQRKQAETALRTREAQLRMFIAHAPAALAMFDREMRYLVASERWREEYGLDDQPLAGRSHYAIFPEIGEEWKAVHRRGLAGEVIRQEEDRFVRADGSVQWLTWEVRPWLALDGGVGGIMIFTEDITARKRNAAALEDSEARYRLILDNAADATFVATPKGRFIYVNNRGSELLGYTREELLGMTIPDITPQEDAEHAATGFRQLLETGRLSTELILKRKDGHVVPVELNAILMPDGNAHGSARDISERKMFMEQMAAYQKDLEGLVKLRTQDLEATHKRLEVTQFAMDKAGIGIHWVDCDTGRILYVNPQAADMLGYRVEEMLKLSVPDIDPGFPAEGFGTVTQALRAPGQVHFESTNRTRDGRLFPVEVALYHLPATADTPGRFITFVTDISRRKEVEAALQKAKQAAEAANVAKSTFLASMSHEIRTPLNAILGLTHLMMRIETDAEHIDKLRKIEQSGHHLLGVINDILDLSKIEAGKLQLVPKHFALAGLLDNVVSMIGGTAAEKGLTVAVESDPTLGWLYGDETRLKQGLLNYASNALKFTERGGIVLRVRRIDSLTGCRFVRFEVRDTGIGIDAATQERLFKSFEQADASTTRKYGGTGLGLVITRRIAELMGGTAGVESTPGGGSTFWFTVWLEEGKPVATEAWTAEASVAALRERFTGVRVLLAEDNAINREVAVDLLQETGLVVDTAENGRIAVDKVRNGQYDLVLMDMQMPEMDGIAATRAIRALPRRTSLPIIAMTANAFDDDRRVCADAGMNDFVAKPVDPPALYGTVLKWLETRTVNPESLDSPGDVSATSATVFTPQTDAAALNRLSAAGIDAAPGLAVLRGKIPLYLKLLHQLVEDHGQDAARLTEMHARGDRAGARAVTHTLKGVAGNLRLAALTEAAKALDDRLVKPPQSDEASVVPGLIEALAQQLERIATALD